MSALESKTLDSKIEMDILDALDEIKAYNERHERVIERSSGQEKPAEGREGARRDDRIQAGPGRARRRRETAPAGRRRTRRQRRLRCSPRRTPRGRRRHRRPSC